MTIRRAYVQPQIGAQGFARTRKVIGALLIPILVPDLTTGNQVAVFFAPKDFVVTGINAVVPSLAASGLTINIGDAANNARFVSASAVGVAGGTISTFAAGGQYYQFPSDTEILMTFNGAVTPAAGNITNFLMEGFIGP
jgi:hypothetical protein